MQLIIKHKLASMLKVHPNYKKQVFSLPVVVSNHADSFGFNCQYLEIYVEFSLFDSQHLKNVGFVEYLQKIK